MPDSLILDVTSPTSRVGDTRHTANMGPCHRTTKGQMPHYAPWRSTGTAAQDACHFSLRTRLGAPVVREGRLLLRRALDCRWGGTAEELVDAAVDVENELTQCGEG